jgi:hypothetical protein
MPGQTVEGPGTGFCRRQFRTGERSERAEHSLRFRHGPSATHRLPTIFYAVKQNSILVCESSMNTSQKTFHCDHTLTADSRECRLPKAVHSRLRSKQRAVTFGHPLKATCDMRNRATDVEGFRFLASRLARCRIGRLRFRGPGLKPRRKPQGFTSGTGEPLYRKLPA